MRAGLQSGSDSGLRDLWDEICVQYQMGDSIYRDLYGEALEAIVSAEASRLPRVECEAIWLGTRFGEEWLDDIGEKTESSLSLIPLNMDEVCEAIEGTVQRYAADWSNPRIRSYLARGQGFWCVTLGRRHRRGRGSQRSALRDLAGG